jgi:uncharacterized protein YdbL (DUF1318 family)
MTDNPKETRMLRPMRWLFLSALLVLAACVTINVYFPAAEAERAAREFVDDVIGRPANGQTPHKDDANRGAFMPRLQFALIGSAHAQADINIRTPAIQAIRERMRARFETLRPHFDSGAIGMTADGRIAVRDPAALPLRDRATLNQLVAEDNRDRDAVYREIAVANGHPEWETQIRQTFAREWIERAASGWHYQDAGGNWSRK